MGLLDALGLITTVNLSSGPARCTASGITIDYGRSAVTLAKTSANASGTLTIVGAGTAITRNALQVAAGSIGVLANAVVVAGPDVSNGAGSLLLSGDGISVTSGASNVAQASQTLYGDASPIAGISQSSGNASTVITGSAGSNTDNATGWAGMRITGTLSVRTNSDASTVRATQTTKRVRPRTRRTFTMRAN